MQITKVYWTGIPYRISPGCPKYTYSVQSHLVLTIPYLYISKRLKACFRNSASTYKFDFNSNKLVLNRISAWVTVAIRLAFGLFDFCLFFFWVFILLPNCKVRHASEVYCFESLFGWIFRFFLPTYICVCFQVWPSFWWTMKFAGTRWLGEQRMARGGLLSAAKWNGNLIEWNGSFPLWKGTKLHRTLYRWLPTVFGQIYGASLFDLFADSSELHCSTFK